MFTYANILAMDEKDATRAKILGTLIRDARLHARRSIAECAQTLNLAPETFAKVETGEHVISLPDLEVLAMYLEVPMGHFWGSVVLGESSQPDYSNLVALRHRMIGVLLCQLRLRNRRSTQDLADALDVDVDLIEAYESGTTIIPFLHLERLAQFLDVSIDYFVDDERGPLARHEAEKKLQQQFDRLSPEMQIFLVNPVNVNYLETAKRLSEMDVDKLRQIAESILDITF